MRKKHVASLTYLWRMSLSMLLLYLSQRLHHVKCFSCFFAVLSPIYFVVHCSRLLGPSESTRFQWPDHISDLTFEKMATALMQGDLKPNGRLVHQYSVCVYVKAIIHLYHVSRTTDNMAIRSQISQTRTAYAIAALRSIEYLSILTRPDLSTIQCLLSSVGSEKILDLICFSLTILKAFLMQVLGRLDQCWVLTSYAARQIVSLNYQKINTPLAPSHEEQEIHNAVYWCYYLDRTLSSLLGRPTSLPDLQISPTDLIRCNSSSLYDGLIRVLVDLAQVQGNLHQLSTNGSFKGRNEILNACQSLESRMQSIYPRLKLVGSHIHFNALDIDSYLGPRLPSKNHSLRLGCRRLLLLRYIC